MLLIHYASQLLTLSGGPQGGSELGNLGIIPGGAVLIDHETIAAVGSSSALLQQYPTADCLDAHGRVVMPGFVDPHTHLIWAGDRSAEFEMRLQGKTYMQIMAAGGGILSSLKATRQASLEDLVRQSQERSAQAFRHGTTTMEAKSGYGLDIETELKQLQAVLNINHEGPIELAATFMGAHAIPPEFQLDPEAYVTFLCGQALPKVKTWWSAHANGQALPFVDVFCEQGVFDLDQTRRIFAAAKALGFPLKVHADEFENLGGASLAADMGAVSADHLVKTSQADIEKLAATNTVAVSLPGTPFGLAQDEYTPTQKIIAANGLLALATDLNPGTCWCESMQLVIALGCRYMKLTPAQAIAASTINAAAAIQRDERIGSIEVGKQADLLLLSVDDYRHLGYRFGTNLVSTIIKKGKAYPVS